MIQVTENTTTYSQTRHIPLEPWGAESAVLSSLLVVGWKRLLVSTWRLHAVGGGPNQALVDSDCILLKLVWVQIKKNYLQKGYPAHGGGGSGVVSFVRSVVGQKRYS